MASTEASPGTALLPLSGCVISLSGRLPGGGNRTAVEQRYIQGLGATLSNDITSETTHLVCSELDYKRRSRKVADAYDYYIPILTFYWLEDSLKNNRRMKEDDYTFESSSPGALAKNNLKRQHSEETNGDENQSQAKRLKPDEVDEKKEQPRIGEAQIAKTRNVTVPLDIGAEDELKEYEVYIDKEGIIYDASLSLASSSSNHNKFYRIQLLRHRSNTFKCRVRWGRVGTHGASKIHGDNTEWSARMEFNSKFQSKTGLSWVNRTHPPRPKKYVFIEKSYELETEDDPDSEVVLESRLTKPVQELMKLIFNKQYFAAAMKDLKYNDRTLPLGKLSEATIMRGYETLTKISALLNDPSLADAEHETFDSAVEDLSNYYFSVIPHVFGKAKPPIIKDSTLLKQEIELLDSLSDMRKADELLKKAEGKKSIQAHPADIQFNSLGLEEMVPLESTSQEFLQLKDLLLNTQGMTHHHNYEISQIFRVSRKGEQERLEEAYGPQMLGTRTHRRLLWHGSRCTNFGGILSQGLRIAPPEAPANGYSMSSTSPDTPSLFGKGVYLADTSSKSVNYCHSQNSNGHALLLLCEAELGQLMQYLTTAEYNAPEIAKANGNIATFAGGQNGPLGWRDAKYIHPSLNGIIVPKAEGIHPNNITSSLFYNEYICYDERQVRIRYLFRLRM
ncbi:PARP-domain-containing protein [Annulohypoxylon nitens]|nr:PARP-domain-containing protein [Annulohypoxylon nitens]